MNLSFADTPSCSIAYSLALKASQIQQSSGWGLIRISKFALCLEFGSEGRHSAF